MISKTKISKRVSRKTDSDIIEVIREAKKNEKWMKIAQAISGSKRNYSSVNLNKIDRNTKEGDTVIIVGKVLGSGEINKRVRVCALGFSESAKEKLKNQRGEIVMLMDEIKKNPKMEGVKVIK